MSGFKTYTPGEAFPGVIGRTSSESELAWPVAQKAPEDAPNIFIVLLDDVGFAQIGCYGSLIDTPNFDRLTKSGLVYSNFHTTAMCSPTARAF